MRFLIAEDLYNTITTILCNYIANQQIIDNIDLFLSIILIVNSIVRRSSQSLADFQPLIQNVLIDIFSISSENYLSAVHFLSMAKLLYHFRNILPKLKIFCQLIYKFLETDFLPFVRNLSKF